MINIIKGRIKACKLQISKTQAYLANCSEHEEMLYKGILIGLKGELDTLKGLLASAETMAKLEAVS